MSEMQNDKAAEGTESKKQARKRAEGLWWAVALIWAGLVFWTDSLNLLPQIGGADAWSWVFLGAGMLDCCRISTISLRNPLSSPQPGTGSGLVASLS